VAFSASARTCRKRRGRPCSTGLLLLGLVAYGIRLRWRGWAAFGLALFVAGGVSNWVDRVLHGSVIDFINVGVGPLRTGVFNVADVAILTGVGIVLISEFTRTSRVRSGPR